MTRPPSPRTAAGPSLPARLARGALILLAAALPALSGCGSRPPEREGSVLRLAQLAEPTTLDPALVRDGPTIEILLHVFEGLVRWDTQNRVVPALARSWEVSEDGRTYTFLLRDGVKFHNGRPLAASDFVYSITRCLAPATASPVAMTYLDDLVGARAFSEGRAAAIEGVEAPDDRTLRLTIDRPKAYFLAKLTYPTAYAVCREAVEAAGGRVGEGSMVGTGPFRLGEYRRGDRVVLEAFPEYYEGAPRMARIERRILLDGGTRHDKFEAGELDIVDVPMTTYRADSRNPRLAPLLREFERASVYYLALNQKAFAPFRDRRVRLAFAHAVNKAQIIRSVHQGVPRLANGILPAGIPGFDPNFAGIPYDPEKARRLLADAGYPGGAGFPELKLNFRASVEDIRNTAVAVAGDLKTNLGIHVQPDEVEWNTFLTRQQRGEQPFAFLRWAADYLDPQNFLSTLLHGKAPLNPLGYANPEFDRLCDQADVMQDEEQRMATYRRAEAIAVNDVPWIPIYYQKDVELWSSRLRGVEPSLFGHLPHRRTYLEPAASQ